jgi:hypothetical protein
LRRGEIRGDRRPRQRDLVQLLDLHAAWAAPHLRAGREVHAAPRDGALADYQFGKRRIHHLFCRNCGIESFARGTVPGTEAEMVAVNVRCLDGVELAALAPKPFDGRSL